MHLLALNRLPLAHDVILDIQTLNRTINLCLLCPHVLCFYLLIYEAIKDFINSIMLLLFLLFFLSFSNVCLIFEIFDLL